MNGQDKDTQAARPSLGRRLLIVLATVTGNVYLVFGSVFFGGLAVLIGWIPPRGRVVFEIARLWSQLLLLSSFTRVEAEFESEIETAERYVFMANHQSLYDIPALLCTLPVQARFLAKRSLFQIPFFGWGLKAGGFISIDRHDRSSAGKSFAHAVEEMKHGASTLVYPEGSRTLDGKVLPLERGGFLLALKAELPIVPVGIRGSLQVQKRTSFAVRPGTIRVRYGTALDPMEYGLRRKDDLTDHVRHEIARLAETALADEAAD